MVRLLARLTIQLENVPNAKTLRMNYSIICATSKLATARDKAHQMKAFAVNVTPAKFCSIICVIRQ
jgi:hypothetical protein